jgi:hypothetical protein
MFAQESVMDIKKLKAEFEKLKYVEEKLEYLNFDEHLGCYVEKNNGMPVGLAAWVNGALYGFNQAATAQAVVHFDNTKLLKAFPDFKYRPLPDSITRISKEMKALYHLSD